MPDFVARSCHLGIAALCLALVSPAPSEAQASAPGSAPSAVIEKLFVAMRASDTAAARASFASSARVIPVPSGNTAAAGSQGLSLDQFIAFIASIPPGSWIERMWSPSVRVSDALADVWFEYDVYRRGRLDHCGVNAVQLQQTAAGWRIMSMAFTSSTAGCAAHAPPV